MSIKRLLSLSGVALACAGLLGGCATQKQQPQWAFDDDSIRSVLVLPVVSQSTQVGSDILMYSMSTFPIAEKGYYTYPVETVRMVLEHEGLYEPERVHQIEPAKLASMFDADAVLKINVNFWDAQYALVNTTIAVAADYELYRRDGTPLWSDSVRYQWRSDGGQASSDLGGLIANMIVAAAHRASPDFRPAASAVNSHAIRYWHPGPILEEEMAAALQKQRQKADTATQPAEKTTDEQSLEQSEPVKTK